MKNRIHILDELRGLCVALMVIYHALYTYSWMFDWEFATKMQAFFFPVEPLFAGIFIALCGFSCRLSRNNWRRGGLLALVALGMTGVLWVAMPSQVIWFGVLHCLAVCILVFAAAKPLLDRIPPLVGFLVSAALAALLWTVPTTFGGKFLGMEIPFAWSADIWWFPLGFSGLYSADYFPLIPWLFVFMAGTFVAQWRDRLPSWCMKPHVKPLSFLGRCSLIVYLVHQPLIILLGQIIFQ